MHRILGGSDSGDKFRKSRKCRNSLPQGLSKALEFCDIYYTVPILLSLSEMLSHWAEGGGSAPSCGGGAPGMRTYILGRRKRPRAWRPRARAAPRLAACRLARSGAERVGRAHVRMCGRRSELGELESACICTSGMVEILCSAHAPVEGRLCTRALQE